MAERLMSEKSDRLCLECSHCDLDWGWFGTEVTPGDPLVFRCRKGFWDAEVGEPGREGLLQMLRKAGQCADFEGAHFGDTEA